IDREHRLRGVEEHRQMVDMLRRQDKKGLKQLTAKHVGDVSKAVARILSSNQTNQGTGATSPHNHRQHEGERR
ncbi:MAG: hypothetical protein IH612_20905, partial [Desulfofustis sp.]|nr:hypothetical protein [Desulfofustis sp.]